jgi:hypothetical protein
MNFQVNGPGAWVILLPLLNLVLIIYFVLRFLRAMERGVAAHERIANELGELWAGGGKERTGAGGT